MILYFAPGSGAGHLNRALAICLELRKAGVRSEIVTNSPFAQGIAHAARFPILRIADHYWAKGAREYLEHVKPVLAVADAFPAGLRGEWIEPVPVPLVYVARRLRLDSYIDPAQWPRFELTVEAEPLGPAHRTAVQGPLVALRGPVRMAPGTIRTPVPPALEDLLAGGDATLVVHSGPQPEIQTLIRAADSGRVVLLSPWDTAGVPRFDYYPAGNVLARARRVVTGGGYNVMADMLFLRDRHVAIPFERRYDDQAARVKAAWFPESDGTSEAARLIAAAAASLSGR